jgi:hypothetical protein
MAGSTLRVAILPAQVVRPASLVANLHTRPTELQRTRSSAAAFHGVPEFKSTGVQWAFGFTWTWTP